jgi:hypothetical protein
MDSFTFSLRFCLRGGKFLPGYIGGFAFSGKLLDWAEEGRMPCEMEMTALRTGLVSLKDK